MAKLSLLITTYNDPLRLGIVLTHYLKHRPQPFEILVCDDGSKPETKALVDSFARISRTPILHVYQEDHGWDPSGIRNLGALKASGDYLLLTDGDCVPHPRFIHDHLAAMEKGCFVCGDRAHVVIEHVNNFSTNPVVVIRYILQKRIQKRILAIRNPFEKAAVYTRSSFSEINALASLALCCNYGVWKDDLMAVNGFEEIFHSWWAEDAECSARLLNLGLKFKKFRRKCLVYHLNHPESVRNWEKQRLFAQESLLSNKIETANGIKQHLNKTP